VIEKEFSDAKELSLKVSFDFARPQRSAKSANDLLEDLVLFVPPCGFGGKATRNKGRAKKRFEISTLQTKTRI